MAVKLVVWIEDTNLAEDDQYADLNAVGARIIETMRPTNTDGQYAFSLEEDPDDEPEEDDEPIDFRAIDDDVAATYGPGEDEPDSYYESADRKFGYK